jgi:hypothetical protein
VFARSTDFEDLRRRLRDRYRGSLSAAALKRVIEKANFMAHMGGRLAVLEEV